MSKIGLKPIQLGGTKIEVVGSKLKVVGKKAIEEIAVPAGFKVEVGQGSVLVTSVSEEGRFDRKLKTAWGTFRANLANLIVGVEKGFESTVVISGLGYKAVVEGKTMVFSLGYSHKLRKDIPTGISVELDRTGQRIIVRATSALALGDFCASLKSLRKVEPYKATGVVIEGDVVLRKVGKSTK